VVPKLSFETALQELSAGQHDAVVIQKLVAYQIMARAGLKNLITVGPPLQDFKQNFCFAVRKGDADLLATLNEGLSLVIANDTFRALRAKWFSDLEALGRTKSQILVSGDINFPPYEFLDENGQPAGFNVDLTRAIARRAGLSVDIRLGPWSSIRDGLATGTVDVVQGMFYSVERDESFSFSTPHSVVQYAIVVREGARELAELKDLAGKSVLVMKGDIMEDVAVKQGYGPLLVAVASQEEALRLLAEGKHDAALVAKVPALRWIELHGWSNLRVSPHAVLSPEYCYAVPHGKNDILAALNEGLAAVKETGEFRKIQAKWLGPYEKSGSDVRKLMRTAAMVFLPLLGLVFALLLWSHSLKRQVAKQTQALVADIAARKQAEEERAQTHDLLTNLTRLVPGVVYQYRLFPDGRSAFPYASPGMNDIYEVKPEEVQHDATPVFGRLHPDDYERVATAIQESARTLQTFYCEFRVILPRQGLRWRWSQAQPERTEDGGTLWHGIISDITARKQAETALSASRTRLALATRAGGVGVWDYDVIANQLVWDEQMFQLYGITREQFSGAYEAWRAGVHPEDRQRSDDETQAALRGEKEFDTEFRVLWPDGGTHYIRALAAVERDAAGQAVRMVGTNWDITERKQAEERLRQQVALLDSASDAIYVRTLDHTLTYWNDGAARLYGWSAAETVGRKLTELGLFESEWFAKAHAALLAQGDWSGEVHKTGKDGKEHVVFCRWTLLRDELGHPREVLAINTDITDKKQLESRYLRAQRMEGIGMLAGGLAHDLNNILTPILMSAPLLRGAVRDADDLEIIDSVENSARRGADIIRQLLTFARGKPGVRAPILVRQQLREMEKLIRETFPRNLRLAVSVPPELWPVLGDATQIHQALMNLCVNARDAMPDGGALTLAADNATLDAAAAAQIPDAKPGPHVRLWVSDTGTGISPEQLEHIFDPFFTTKEIGKGTGLGLPTVLGIVRGHGGSVRVASRVGQGSTFELYLPASPEAAAAAAPERESRLPRGNGELILVVDDEAAVRGPAQHVLEKFGYRVLTAAEGGEALKLFDRHRSEIKAVLTDMMMPGIDGPKLVRALRQLDARLPILGMTGLIERGTFKGMEGLDSVPLLAKPFELENLLVALHQILAPGNPTSGSAE
jgi:PAS domain S-box-containing protein